MVCVCVCVWYFKIKAHIGKMQDYIVPAYLIVLILNSQLNLDPDWILHTKETFTFGFGRKS